MGQKNFRSFQIQDQGLSRQASWMGKCGDCDFLYKKVTMSKYVWDFGSGPYGSVMISAVVWGYGRLTLRKRKLKLDRWIKRLTNLDISWDGNVNECRTLYVEQNWSYVECGTTVLNSCLRSDAETLILASLVPVQSNRRCFQSLCGRSRPSEHSSPRRRPFLHELQWLADYLCLCTFVCSLHRYYSSVRLPRRLTCRTFGLWPLPNRLYMWIFQYFFIFCD